MGVVPCRRFCWAGVGGYFPQENRSWTASPPLLGLLGMSLDKPGEPRAGQGGRETKLSCDNTAAGHKQREPRVTPRVAHIVGALRGRFGRFLSLCCPFQVETLSRLLGGPRMWLSASLGAELRPGAPPSLSCPARLLRVGVWQAAPPPWSPPVSWARLSASNGKEGPRSARRLKHFA